MKREINQLIKIGKEYIEYGKQVELNAEKHTIIRPKSENKKEIQIYFADNKKTTLISFGDIEVRFFCNDIIIPFNTTVKEMKEIIKDAKEFLEKWKDGEIQ